jgi:hypothetical protein
VQLAPSTKGCGRGKQDAGKEQQSNLGINILESAMMMNPIMIVEYDPRWPELFESLHERIAGKLGKHRGGNRVYRRDSQHLTITLTIFDRGRMP